VNSLNVFPVPDGDTGTNMVLTMQSAWAEIANLGERSIGKLCHALAHGALMGARGNSGVILSQLWRGFARTLDNLPSMDSELMVKALAEARDTAYKGVVRPVEGTILTVSKDIAQAAEGALSNGATSTLDILEQIVEAAAQSVERTPDLLPVLRDAGVVDSGGKGLFFILEGMLRTAHGLPLDRPLASVQPLSSLSLENAVASIEPGQDWEVVVDFRPSAPLDAQAFYKRLEEMGTSIQVGEGDGMYRMHIHVLDNTQYEPIEYVRRLGTITNVAIENLMVQMADQAANQSIRSLRLATVEPGQIAAVAVAPAMGIARVFASLGVAMIVEGGQTMNPSTEEILNAFENLPTDKIVILPNNKNVLMTARQALDLTAKHVAVVPSKSVPQGIAAMLALTPDGDFETSVATMTKALSTVKTGEVTIATRSVEMDGVDVKEGQVIGLLNGRLAVAGDDPESVTLEMLAQAGAEEAELVTLYYGADLSVMRANQLADKIRERFPKQEVELIEGGQPHYQLIFSVE
ncbi:MAG: DAK2 domain-containing protein, partial [Anaerolineales bacterium]|nr:DAK2 domain-containing protein [Anaerolineales bacterium]